MSKEDNETPKLNAVDLYNELWKGRDFEINALWQRSVFLGAFMLAILAGFITVIAKLSDIPDKIYFKDFFNNFYFVNNSTYSFYIYILFVISSVGLLFSVLWICMAKGSKYWYECYESSIDSIFKNKKWKKKVFTNEMISLWMGDDLAYNRFLKNFNDDINKVINSAKDQNLKSWHRRNIIDTIKYYKSEKSKLVFPYHGHLSEHENSKFILNTKGGRYSPSRVNIAIGQVFGFFWIVMIVFLSCNIWKMRGAIVNGISLLLISWITLGFLIIACFFLIYIFDQSEDSKKILIDEYEKTMGKDWVKNYHQSETDAINNYKERHPEGGNDKKSNSDSIVDWPLESYKSFTCKITNVNHDEYAIYKKKSDSQNFKELKKKLKNK